MASASLRPCLTTGCDQLVSHGRCPEHTKQLDKSTQRTGRKLYASKQWKGLRFQVLREQPICDSCHTGLSWHVDHIVPLDQGGAPLDRRNVHGLCASCHSKKTAREVWHVG